MHQTMPCSITLPHIPIISSATMKLYETYLNMSVSENWVPLKHIVAHRFRHWNRNFNLGYLGQTTLFLAKSYDPLLVKCSSPWAAPLLLLISVAAVVPSATHGAPVAALASTGRDVPWCHDVTMTLSLTQKDVKECKKDNNSPWRQCSCVAGVAIRPQHRSVLASRARSLESEYLRRWMALAVAR